MLFFIFKAFIVARGGASIFIRSYPSDILLNDSVKRNAINQMLNDINTDLTTYMQLLSKSIIKEKQILTTTGKQILMLPEHRFLYEKLKQQYPDLQFESMSFLQFFIRKTLLSIPINIHIHL